MTVVMLLLVAGIMANLLKPWPLAIIVDSVLGPHPLPHFLQSLHRLSTIRRVDKILTLQDGRLVEDGSPLELLQHPGYYARVSMAKSASSRRAVQRGLAPFADRACCSRRLNSTTSA